MATPVLVTLIICGSLLISFIATLIAAAVYKRDDTTPGADPRQPSTSNNHQEEGTHNG